ncbi:MAG TPA: glycosyltransferase [Terracidiphilus sp.]
MPWRRLIEPWRDRPILSWMIFPVVFVAMYCSHWSLMRLPYYWDEAGYYIPAALDFFRTGSLIPTSTLTNAHPPLPSIYLALWWKTSGFYPEVTREAVLIVASLALLAVRRLVLRIHGSPSVAFWVVVLTGAYPIWFAQSTLAHADIFAAAFTLWGLVYALPDGDRKPWAAAFWFTAAVLSKETAIAIPLTLAGMRVIEGVRVRPPARFALWKEAGWLSVCVVPLAAWYAWHYAKTGFLFGNPEFLRYNAEATLAPGRIAAAFAHRVLHLTAHMNMFVPMLLTIAALMLEPRVDPQGHARPGISATVRWRIAILLLVNTVLFSVLGGALLCRYLLPMYPLVLLLAVVTFYRRVPYWYALAVLSMVGFIAGLFINPPYGFAPEDNLAYAHVIRLHQAGIAQLARRYPGATVLSAWPATDELRHPDLGYVKQPFDVFAIDDFSAPQIARAADDPGKYSAALVFSTKYDPPRPLLTLGPRSAAMDERYFGLHHDMQPDAIARQLGGELVWRKDDQGGWIGLIRFNRQFEAALDAPGPLPPLP